MRTCQSRPDGVCVSVSVEEQVATNVESRYCVKSKVEKNCIKQQKHFVFSSLRSQSTTNP